MWLGPSIQTDPNPSGPFEGAEGRGGVCGILGMFIVSRVPGQMLPGEGLRTMGVWGWGPLGPRRQGQEGRAGHGPGKVLRVWWLRQNHRADRE